MAGVWVSSYCLNTEGFPKILYATLQKLGVRERPEYEGREYMKRGTERCKVTVYIGKSEEFPDLTEAWNVTATGFRFGDTYQVVARKALQHLCQIFEGPIARTPMRFFPPWDKNRRVWRACMEALHGLDVQEDNPTLVHLTSYLLALDEQYDRQASELRECLHRAEEAEIFSRMLEVQLAEAHANLAAAESREAAMAEAVKVDQDRHAQELEDAYLATRAKRRTLATERQEPLILEGIPVHPLERRRTGFAAPPPTEASEVESLLPLTQPPPQEGADPQPSAAEEPQEPRKEAVWADEVD
jgi:hypothetical protein